MRKVEVFRFASMLALAIPIWGMLFQTGCVEEVEGSASLGEAPSALESSVLSVGWTRYPGAHWCISTGFDSHSPRYQGVVCLDVDYQTVSGGRNYNVGIELKCGTDAGTQRCISALAKAEYSVGNGGPNGRWTGRCVPGPNPCNPDLTFFPSPTSFKVSTNSCVTLTARADARQGAGGFTLPDGVQKVTTELLDVLPILICGH